MKILIGTGNSVTTAFNTTAKTLVFTGAYNFDIVPDGNFSVYSTTASKWIFGGGPAETVPGITASAEVQTYVAGLPVQTMTFSALPAGVANGDTLIIFCDAPDSVALYNSVIFT